jgi:hypothetical protein
MRRFSLAGSLWSVAFFGVVFAAVRNPSNFWLGATFLATLGVLCTSVIGAVLERRRGGVWWLGFAVFGWPYLIACSIPGLDETARMPSKALANSVVAASIPAPSAAASLNNPNLPIGLDGRPIAPAPGIAVRGGFNLRLYNPDHAKKLSLIIGYFLILLFARVGATVSCVFTNGLPWRRRPSGGVASSPAA